MLRSIRLGTVPSLQLAALNNPPLMKGQTSSGVAAVQELLCDLGHDFIISVINGKFDGIFGDETKRNVEAFQRQSALKADGIAGAMTLKRLDDTIIANNILELHNLLVDTAFDFRDQIVPLHFRRRATA